MKTIMLVDDSATVLLSISGILAKAGFQVVTASSAEDGQKKLASGTKPDLLITDLNSHARKQAKKRAPAVADALVWWAVKDSNLGPID